MSVECGVFGFVVRHGRGANRVEAFITYYVRNGSKNSTFYDLDLDLVNWLPGYRSRLCYRHPGDVPGSPQSFFNFSWLSSYCVVLCARWNTTVLNFNSPPTCLTWRMPDEPKFIPSFKMTDYPKKHLPTRRYPTRVNASSSLGDESLSGWYR